MMKLFLLFAILASAFACPALYGSDYLIRSISIVSNERTRDHIIRQELDFHTNDVVSFARLTNGITNSVQSLENTGLFGEVGITFTTDTNASAGNGSNKTIPADLTVMVLDKWTLFPVPFYFYSNDTGNSFGFILTEGNFLGLNQSLGLTLSYQQAPNDYYAELDYTYPRLFRSYLYLDVKFFYENYVDSQYLGKKETLVYRATNTSVDADIKLTYRINTALTPFAPGIRTLYVYQSNQVTLNTSGTVPSFRTSLYVMIGTLQGQVNQEADGIKWGDDNHIWAGISPLDATWMFDLQHAKYFTVFGHDVFAYRLSALITPDVDEPLDTSLMRGIRLGEVRGNYIVFGNVEYRKFIWTIPWPTPLDLYIPLFADFGNGTIRGNSFDWTRTMLTAGIGLRLYPEFFGGNGSVIRFDTGVNISKILYGLSFADYFYIAFDFSDVF